jgi:excisionase family DNA binding protein
MDMNYYTVEQVSELTGMGKDWLWKQCADRRIPHHRFGRSYRFTVEDLRQLQQATAVIPQAAAAAVVTGVTS